MHKLIMLFASLGMIAALTGCNSMDDLTPQVDVGAGTFTSPPVNQADLDSMQTVDVAPQASTPVQSTQLAAPERGAPEQEGFSEGPSGTVMAQGDTDYTDPAGVAGGAGQPPAARPDPGPGTAGLAPPDH